LVACCTPYKPENLEVDPDQLRSLVKWFVRVFERAKSEIPGGIVANPVAGECEYTTVAEKKLIVKTVKKAVGTKVSVVAGVFGWTTADAIQVAKDAKEAGADAFMIHRPYVFLWDPDRTPEYFVEYVRAINEAVPLPMVIHAGGLMGGISIKNVMSLCEDFENVVAVKMTYGVEAYDTIMRAVVDFEKRTGRHISCLGARGYLYNYYLASGRMDGTLTGSDNVCLDSNLKYIQAWRKGDFREALKIWDGGLGQLQRFIYGNPFERFHTRYKYGCWIRGLIKTPKERPPKLPLPKEEEETLRGLTEKAGVRTPKLVI
jgi:4-hydroxy-tetrahydrodipicolinate synthase